MSKKRKIDNECRTFKEEWTTKYFFTQVGNRAICLLCCQSVAENVSRHHATKNKYFGNDSLEVEC